MNSRVDSPWIGVVLCAGLGSRLRPLTNHVPKPLVPIVDRPLAEFAVTQLTRASAAAIKLNAYHLAAQVSDFARSLKHLSIAVTCHVESELLGTGGALAALHGGQSVVVWNGDIFAPDLSLNWVNEAPLDAPTLVVAPSAPGAAPNRGTLGLDAAGNVVRVRTRRFGTECSGVDYIGVALLPPAFNVTLPRRGCLIADGILPWLAAGKRVHTRLFEAYWSDGGTLEEYLLQNRYWLRRTFGDGYIAPGAVCDPDVTVLDSVVGRGARVLGHGALERTVVWPGARVTAPLRDAVVLSNGDVIAAPARGLI
jgi:mannose-1-phosphate guanylyltransferase